MTAPELLADLQRRGVEFEWVDGDLRCRAPSGALTAELRTAIHERKAEMAARSDAFVALPGGLGTLEELFEALTWTQIGIHAKPCGVLNVEGYFDALLAFLDHTVAEGIVAARKRSHLVVASDPDRLLDGLVGSLGCSDLAVEGTSAAARRRDGCPGPG